jgi:hypothetical protein
MKVSAYGERFWLNVPQDMEQIEQIWLGALDIWSTWVGHLPQPFADAAQSITSAGMPLYKSGNLCRILLLGELVRMGVVYPPTRVGRLLMVRGP